MNGEDTRMPYLFSGCNEAPTTGESKRIVRTRVPYSRSHKTIFQSREAVKRNRELRDQLRETPSVGAGLDKAHCRAFVPDGSDLVTMPLERSLHTPRI